MDTTQAMMEPGEPFNWFRKYPQPPARAEQPLTPTTVHTDLCDAECPQAAVYRVDRPDVGCLTFCAHHYDANEPALAAGGWAPSQLRPRPS